MKVYMVCEQMEDAGIVYGRPLWLFDNEKAAQTCVDWHRKNYDYLGDKFYYDTWNMLSEDWPT